MFTATVDYLKSNNIDRNQILCIKPTKKQIGAFTIC